MRRPSIIAAVAVGALIATAAVTTGCKAQHTQAPVLVGAEAIDASNAKGPQSESAIAVNPRDDRQLIAGSNDLKTGAMRVYSSLDGGAHWRSATLPLPTRSRSCNASDPSVAFSGDGRAHFVFLGIRCGGSGPSRVYISTRDTVGGRWSAPQPVDRLAGQTVANDRPNVAVDVGAKSGHRGRLYAAWTRFSFEGFDWNDPDAGAVPLVDVSVVVAYSDGGARWSRPVVLSRDGDPLEVRLAVADDGTVFATWRSATTNAIFIASSPDGRRFTTPKLVAAAVVDRAASCHTFRARIPAQPRRCVSPNPVIVVDTSPSSKRRGHVYVAWGSTALNRSQDVYVAAYDKRLQPQLGVRRLQHVNPAEPFQGPDQFLPTAAVDPSSGRIWVCYYRSVGSAHRGARFTCQTSSDGGQGWSAPIATTAVVSDETKPPANLGNGYGDYEAVVALATGAVAIWTDSRRLRQLGEEIFTRRIGLRDSNG